jgi:DNA polymerase elongation subunit (family B)
MTGNFYTNAFLRGNKIFYRGYSMGLPVKKIIAYQPYLFMPNKDGEYSSLEGQKFGKMQFEDVKSAREFVATYKDVVNVKLYGIDNFLYLFLYDTYPDTIHHDPELIKRVTIDIECAADEGFPSIEKADKEITAITLRHRGKSFVFGCGDFVTDDSTIIYSKCDNEVELLSAFLMCWQSIEPDVVTGWNIEFFDIPYLINRILLVMGETTVKILSPWKIVDKKEIEFKGKKNQSYVIQGVNVLDYYQLYRKFKFGNSESYKLDYISQVELKEKKIDYSEFGSLLELYKNNFQKFIEYNIHDCILVDRLDAKLGFIDQVIAHAYMAKVNYIDTLTTIRPSDMIIHSVLMNKKIVVPPVQQHNLLGMLMGGYVKEPKLGLSKWVVSFDLDSLYPHLIMHYNISPEMFNRRLSDFPSIDQLVEGYNIVDAGADKSAFSYTANGCEYRKDRQGFLPEIMQSMYDDRVTYKKLMLEAKKSLQLIEAELKRRDMQEDLSAMRKEDLLARREQLTRDVSRYHNLQLSKKISLNSFYGAL